MPKLGQESEFSLFWQEYGPFSPKDKFIAEEEDAEKRYIQMMERMGQRNYPAFKELAPNIKSMWRLRD